MILFFISLILVCLTALFTASILEKKEFIKFLIYFLAIMFADVVLIFEILSLFNSISVAGFMLLDTVLFTGAFFAWKKYSSPVPNFSVKPFFNKLMNTLKRDKYLVVLGVCFIFMCCVSLFLISFMPIVNPDAESYHVVRSLFWIGNGNLNHFDTSEVRMLPMPINSELLYAWILMFTKKQIWFGIPNHFLGFRQMIDYFKTFPQEIQQLSIIHCQLSIKTIFLPLYIEYDSVSSTLNVKRWRTTCLTKQK